MTTVRVLVVDDSASDAKLVVAELLRQGFELEWERVETMATFRSALLGSTWDVVLCDWTMPTLTAKDAHATLRETGLDIPFIIVTGTIGEEKAADAMRSGVHDVVLKDRLARLAPAIEREIRDRKLRHRHRISEARFTLLAESGIIGIAFGDLHGKLQDANDTYLRMLGYSRQDLEGGEMRWADLTAPGWGAADAVAVRTLEATGVAAPWELEMLHKDGTRVPVLIGIAMLDPPNCVAFTADLTERKRVERALRTTEEHLRQAQKMEALGGLAAGVAHDFNNLLSVILSNTELAVQQIEGNDELKADLIEVQRAGERAAVLTRQLLAFSRKQVLQPRVLNLNDVLRDLESLLKRLIREDVELTLSCGVDLPNVNVDPGQIEQVVVNLAVNARDAMPAGGKLIVETLSAPAEPAGAARDAVESWVMLTVRDTGSGIDAATQARMFEPFFTTKEQGKGTGLGLSTVLGIVEQSGGSISVDSEVGRGTTFTVLLPAARSREKERSQRPDDTAPRGIETILLVDDDAAVRTVVCSILKRRGYRVLAAEGALDALRVWERDSTTIDLLVTDVVMPHMSGRQLAERLRLLRPGLRVLFMSGYTDDSVVHEGVSDGGIAFLQKPITPATLSRKVREVLDAVRPPG